MLSDRKSALIIYKNMNVINTAFIASSLTVIVISYFPITCRGFEKRGD